MEGLEGYTECQKKTIEEIITNDKGFHTSFMIADIPLAGMLYETEDGIQEVQRCVSASVSNSSLSYDISLYFSEERNCWFFTVTSGTETFQGILHFNTIYNAKGEFAFAFINDNAAATSKEITAALPYCNFLLMRK